MAERIRAETGSIRSGGDQLYHQAEQVDQALKRLREAIERFDSCWGSGEIAEAFAPQYLKQKDQLLDEARNAVKRLHELSNARRSADSHEDAEHDNMRRAQSCTGGTDEPHPAKRQLYWAIARGDGS
jgi:uncharacterized protein YukE